MMSPNSKYCWPSSDTFTAIAGIVFVTLDTQATILNINHYGCQLLEYHADELIGKNWLDYCIPKAQQQVVQGVFQKITSGKLQAEHLQNQIVSRSGQLHTLAWHNMVLRNQCGDVVGTLSSGIDITDRLKTQQQALEDLHSSEMKAQSILDNVSEGIISCDAKGTIVSFNKAAQTMFGYLNDEILGENLSLLTPSLNQRDHGNNILRHLKTGKEDIISAGREIIAQKKDNSTFPAYLSLAETQVRGEHLFTALIRDFSAKKAAELKLKEKENEIHQNRERLAHISRIATLGEITTSIAHEVNQPLAAIATYAQSAYRLTHMEMDNTNELDYVLKQIERQAMRASEVIQHLRGMVTQTGSGRKACHINDIIEDAVTLVDAEAASNRVSIKCMLGSKLPKVDVDEVQIQQVIINLILNAIQAIAATRASQRCVTLRSTHTDDNQVKVSVSDTGTGVSKEHMDKLFTPFFTTRKNGLGIGLSICRTLIIAHEGSLNINRRKRKGSEFFFTLPAVNISMEKQYG